MNLNRRRILQLVAGSAVAIATTGPDAFAAKPQRRKKKRRPLTKKGAPSELPTVKRVGSGSITVGDKYYEVTADTEITVNGRKASLKAVKPGMQVMIAGGVQVYGTGSKDTIYRATRIAARRNDNLKKKANAANRKAKGKR